MKYAYTVPRLIGWEGRAYKKGSLFLDLFRRTEVLCLSRGPSTVLADVF
jgi:hypothetical protein